MSSKDRIYGYQGKALRVAGSAAVVGEVYKPYPLDEVTIGSQTWMSKNLAIDDGQGGIYYQTVNYGQGDVVEYYYTWEAAVRVASSLPGWHLPTRDEWEPTLANAVGGYYFAGTKLKSTYGWSSGNGTDDYGFAVFPPGICYSGTFYLLGSQAYYWTATEKEGDSSKAYRCNFYSGIQMSTDDGGVKSIGYSVRLVKDA